MPLSGSRDFIYTRDQIISAAYRKLKVILPGQTPSADLVTYASEALNVMQLELQNDGVLLWTNTDAAATITANIPYIVLSAYPDIVEISNVSFRLSNSDTALTKMPLEEYKAITNKAETGTPTNYFVEHLIASTKIWLFPVYAHTSAVVTGSDANTYVATTDHTSAAATEPTVGADYATMWEASTLLTTGGAWVISTDYYSGHLFYTKTMRVQDLDAANNNPDFHVRAYQYLVWGLADTIAPEFKQLQECKFYAEKADFYKRRFMLGQAETGSIRIVPRIK